MRWLAALCVVLIATPAGARVFRCTDGAVPVVGRKARYGDCDGDGTANGVCSFRGRVKDEIIPLPLNGHSRAHRSVGEDRFVCKASGAEGPIIAELADSCSEVCTFSLCVDGNAIRRCEDPCRYDARVSLNAYGQSQGVTLTNLGGNGGAVAAVTLRCGYMYLPCLPCSTDVDCDDGIPSTHDACVPSSREGEGGRCFHFCSGDDPIGTSTTVTTTSTSVTLPTCPTTSTLGRPNCGGPFCGPFPCFSGQACTDLGNGGCGCTGPVLCGGVYNVCGGECPSGQTCAPVPVPDGCPNLGCACAGTTTTTLPSCASPCTCAMDSACVQTAEGTAVCIDNPCQQTGCTASAQCGAHQVCSGGECCPLCP